jgi:hypothetical protein
MVCSLNWFRGCGMFSMVINNDQTLASSSDSEGKPATSTGAVNCCKVQTGRRPQHTWWRGTRGCLGSGALLLLIPKCPMCIAAYLTLWTGAGAAMQIATHLRPMAGILFFASALLLAVRFTVRMRSERASRKNPRGL